VPTRKDGKAGIAEFAGRRRIVWRPPASEGREHCLKLRDTEPRSNGDNACRLLHQPTSSRKEKQLCFFYLEARGLCSSGFYTQNGGASGGGYSFYQNSSGGRSYK